ncbi:hypothetical protein B4135_2871 [Caldibacillus debilis]|uniref:Uncharacterized protein n=1 Tax=Caldibacillus debilis TaxID=301148 RepID=A0A150LQ71_9BACI|nr:hypothetical protein B4135_2871 [Caldibacillus debilis]
MIMLHLLLNSIFFEKGKKAIGKREPHRFFKAGMIHLL